MSLEKAKNLFLQLYGSEEDSVWHELLESIAATKAKRSDTVQSHPLSKQDALLICYGDHIQESGKQGLPALLDIYKQTKLNDTFSLLHILPFYPYSSDDGFSVIDYYTVDPKLGGWHDIFLLSQFVNLVVDFPLNHSSSQSEWFKKFLADDRRFSDFFVTVTGKCDLSGVTRPRTHPLLTKFGDKNVWTTFSEDQVDLNYQNSKVFAEMVKVFLFYLEKGASLVRMDAIAYLWKELGTSCIHLPQTHQVVKIFKAIANEVDPNICILTETNVPHEENISYFGDSDEADMVYQFSLPPLLLYSLWSGSTAELVKWAQRLDGVPDEHLFLNFTACHDGIGVRPLEGLVSEEGFRSLINVMVNKHQMVSFKTDTSGAESPYEINATWFSIIKALVDKEEISAFYLTQALVFAFKGVPAVYLGVLVRDTNDIDGYKSSGMKRRVNRRRFNASQFVSDFHKQLPIGRSSAQIFASLAQARNCSVFEPSSPQKVSESTPGVLLVTRGTDNEKQVRCYFNFSSESVSVEFVAGEVLFELLVGDYEARRLSPYGVVWVKEQKKPTP